MRASRVSSALAPVALVAGWTIAARHQPGGFDSIAGTISALAARDATARWIMTSALAFTGSCHVVTAANMNGVHRAGRWVLAAGGVATIAVAAAPLPTGTGTSHLHTAAAALSFGALALWPALSTPTPPTPTPAVRSALNPPELAGPSGLPWPVRPVSARAASGVLALLVVGFSVALRKGVSGGLVERVAAAAEALWPAVVVYAATSDRSRPAPRRA